jgi:alkanesulfonate monooxygenase SsuD/methylene tetrahydromethanopterin reductase-like flavin-dependent oxidoreductase (luciferase family)
MDIGLVLQTDPPWSRVAELAGRADLGGFSHVWTFDSCVLWQEPFVIYSQILAQTSNVMVGPMVTNPLSRELSVTASLFATLNDMFGNRTVCGIGRGDSAMRVLGRPPSSLATLGHAINVIRDLAEGREVDYGGTKVRIPWHMRDQTRWFGGMVGNHVADLVARYGDTGDAVPRALTDYIKAREGYDYSHHGKAGNPSTEFVPDDIVDRFCLLGPPERHVDRLAELRAIGADNFSVYLMHDAQDATLDAYATRVIGAL